jgi:hypothetical protein
MGGRSGLYPRYADARYGGTGHIPGNRDVFVCPSYPPHRFDREIWTYGYVHINEHAALHRDQPVSDHYMGLTQTIEDPSRFIIVIDTANIGMQGYDWRSTHEHPFTSPTSHRGVTHFRHNGLAAAGFMDGRAATLTMDEYVSTMRSQQRPSGIIRVMDADGYQVIFD